MEQAVDHRANLASRLKDIVAGHGGAIVRMPSSTRDRIYLRCEKGHTWSTKAASILYEGTWCPHCAKKRLVVERVNALAAVVGLEVVSIPDTHSGIHIKLKCPIHGEFERSWQRFRACAGCPECGYVHDVQASADVDPGLQALASKHDGQCLLGPYCDGYAVWQCEKGHVFERSIAAVEADKFCDTCMRAAGAAPRQALTSRAEVLEKFRRKVREKGGVVIDIPSESSRTAVVECAEGHQWKPWIANVLYKGTWCKACKDERAKRAGLKNRLAIADKYGLTLVSSDNGKHIWACPKGHEFERTISEVEEEQGCPICR